MEDIKMWAVDDTGTTHVEAASQMDSERLLEKTLAANPDMLIQGLTLVGRQTSTEGGPLDLLGVDADGRLVVFELKRGTLNRDAVAQVIDYASYLDSMSESALFEHIAAQSGADGIDTINDFEEWYLSRFEDISFLKPVRMFLVGLGADDATDRMVSFLAQNSSMDISLLTFYGFHYQGKILLVKQVEVEGALEVEPRPARRRRSRMEHQANFDKRIESFGVHQLVDGVRTMFKENWPKSRERMGAYGLRIQLRDAYQRQYARIDVWSNGTVCLVFFSHAKALCLDAFRLPVEKIPFQTYPSERHPINDPRSEIMFKLDEEVWQRHKEELTTLARAVYESWEDGLDE